MSDAIDRRACYAVVGNPVAHSLSPQIHAAFAEQTGLAIDYRRLLAPYDDFVSTIAGFFDGGGRGLNVTVPFKLEACALCAELSERARSAGAVNWLVRNGADLVGDNTDGIGLVRDLERLAGGSAIRGARVLLIGAGGAARGVVGPLLAREPERLVVVNRDHRRATALVEAQAPRTGATRLASAGFEELADERFDMIVNATSASLGDASLPLPPTVFVGATLAYDLMYGARPTRFLLDAERGGAEAVADGLGMLVEQAAESFRLWLGTMPATSPVLATLRADRASQAR